MDTKELRLEYNRPSFKELLRDNLGCRCSNCGSDKNIEYHHIVPLFQGGTNKLTNIVPLCNRCHKAAHCGRHISKYRSSEHTGRPRKAALSPETEEILWKWANGQIGSAECKNLLGYSQRTHIQDLVTYKEFIKKHGIEKIKNTYDVANFKAIPGTTYKTSTIWFTGDEIKEFYICLKENGCHGHNRLNYDYDEPEIVKTPYGFKYIFDDCD